MTFYDAFPILMDFEGHGMLTNFRDDPGGQTKWGITEAVARENGFTGKMQDLTLGTAMAITQTKYWDAVKADELPDPIRYVVFDSAFHSGVGQSIKWLQRACKVTDDGLIGPATIAATKKVDPYVLKAKICGQRLKFMASLPTWDKFGKGWARRIADIMEA